MSNANEKKNYQDILVQYKRNNKNEFRILGEKFVEKNKNNAKIILNGKEYELTEVLDDKDLNIEDDDILLTIRIFDVTTDISYIFLKAIL